MSATIPKPSVIEAFWFWCTAYRCLLSSVMVRQSLNIVHLWCETHPAPRQCVRHHTQVLWFWCTAYRYLRDSLSAETVCPSPYSSPLVLVYSLPLLAILNYGASVTEQTPLVRDSPSAETSGFGVQLTITRYPRLWCVSN